MKRKEIVFMFLETRCHAKIVNTLSVENTPKNYIGEIDGFEIYKTYGSLFDQFGFEAIRRAK